MLFRLGACRYNLSSIATSVGLLRRRSKLADESGMPCDRLRSLILDWRSRCYQRQRDFEAAREDIERALELARAIDDRVRDRRRRTSRPRSSPSARAAGCSRARTRSSAKTLYEEIADQANVGKLLNNLGGLNFLLGKPDEAKTYLKDAFRVALETGSDAGRRRSRSRRSRRCICAPASSTSPRSRRARRSSSSTVATTTWTRSATRSSSSVARSSSRDRLDEAQAAFDDAESSFGQLSSASHRAAAWIAKGDLEAKRGEDRAAADLYRRAAEALQDFHF